MDMNSIALLIVAGVAGWALAVSVRTKRQAHDTMRQIIEEFEDSVVEMAETMDDQLNAMRAVIAEHESATLQAASEARQAFIQSTDTRERVLPIVMAKLKIKAEGGTLH